MTSRPDHRRTRIAGRLAALLVVPVLVLAACGSDGGSSDGSKATGGSGQLEGTVRTPALQVGAQVGPAAGESRAWGVLGWAAHYAKLGVPAVMGLVTAAYLLLSQHSPLVVIVKNLVAWFRGRRWPAVAR